MEVRRALCFLLVVAAQQQATAVVHRHPRRPLPSSHNPLPLRHRYSAQQNFNPLLPKRKPQTKPLNLRGGNAQLIINTERSFNLLFASLVSACAILVTLTKQRGAKTTHTLEPQPTTATQARSLRARFLAVFWIFKMADWLQGPYFYEVYASKIIGGAPATSAMVARFFLAGFSSTALFGALIGGALDTFGRKRGSLAFALLYALSAFSTRADTVGLLLLGRIAGGLGTSLLFSAPEAWLVSEHQASGVPSSWLSQTFGLAYFGDSIVAIAAGQLAGAAAARRGPVAPFELSILFLATGAALVGLTWGENKGGSSLHEEKFDDERKKLIRRSIQALWNDKRVALVGAVQALFEGAMYVFVLQWVPAMKRLLPGGFPTGKVFSCFMVSCMIGSTSFGALMKRGVSPEDTMVYLLTLAAMAMGGATIASGGTVASPLIAAFLAFEFCVGCYFPLIGTLRSKYLPDAYRGVIMNLFGIPLNLIVVAVFLSIGKLGTVGALGCSFGALVCALLAQLSLRRGVVRVGKKGN